MEDYEGCRQRCETVIEDNDRRLHLFVRSMGPGSALRLAGMTALASSDQQQSQHSPRHLSNPPVCNGQEFAMKQTFQMFAAYNQWANNVLYDAVSKLPDEDYRLDRGAAFHSLHGTLNHILVADRIWMKRLTGDGDAPSKLDTILYDDFALLRIAREAEDACIRRWIDDLTDEDIEGRFTYTTVTDLRTISQRLAPALSHLFNHQTHHRGQASVILTGFGEEAPAMDLIYFQRSKSGRKFA
jgi:uncharacterized damage-inducible protein DinB